jgi:hypothetical protein
METSHGTTASIRTRWAAIGAAIAVTLGAGGGFGLASATLGSGERAVFVAIEPCRLVDTRPAPDTIGPRSTPLGAGDTYNVQARGAQGNCNLPATATGVVLNVTAVGATAQTNLRFFPTGGTAPTVSNLNPAPGAPPAPNSVTTRLATDGRFSIFNFRGTVNLIVDVAGYYTDHHHDDRYYTKAQSDTRYERRPTDKVVLNIFAMQPITPSTTRWQLAPVWVRTAGVATFDDCLFVPIEPPVGARITRLQATYQTTTPGTTVVLSVIGTRNTAGPSVVPFIFMTTESIPAPVTTSGSFGSTGTAITSNNIVLADHNYAAAACTTGDLAISGFEISLG